MISQHVDSKIFPHKVSKLSYRLKWYQPRLLQRMKAAQHYRMYAVLLIASSSKLYQYCLSIANSHLSLQTIEQSPINHSNLLHALGGNFCRAQCPECQRFDFSFRVQRLEPLQMKKQLSYPASSFRRRSVRFDRYCI